jgi:anti-sigma regulatory factor (Ser/Thr protein kinase)
MISLRETYTLEVPADLNSSREAISCALAWLRLQGHAPATLKRWRLPLTEAASNAIVHGCAGHPEARITVSVRVNGDGTEVSVRDPGHFSPPPEADRLQEDLLAEHGRGGFLIAQTTDSFEHHNDALGHTLVLRWNQPPAAPANVTSTLAAEGALDQLALQLGDAYETVTAYAEFAGLLATTSDFGELLIQVRRRLAQAVEHESFVLRLCDGDTLGLGAPAAGFPPAIPRAAPSLEAQVASTRACVALPSAAAIPPGDPLGAASGPVVIVAVGCPRKPRGVLTLVRAANAPAFSAGQIAFTQAVADFLGTAQSLAESWGQRAEQVRLEQEIQLAAQIQQQLLPQDSPSLAGWSLAGGCRTSHAMGGDYFDWIVRDDGSCLVLVADVMGKGMPAAMVATILRSTWRALAGRTEGPGQLLTDLNGQLSRDLGTLEVFITAVLVQFSPDRGRVTYANAGHCALLQRSPSDRAFLAHAVGGPPLGIDPGTRFEETEITVARGDSLFALTDGCYEFDRRRGSTEGLRLLEGELRAASDRDAADVVAPVLRRLQELASGELPDDCTLVALHRFP